jgi:hypothetical protein
MQLTAETVTAAVNDDVARTKEALGKQRTIAAETPNSAEISAFRAELLKSQRWNEAARIQQGTAQLLPRSPEGPLQTIETVAV